MWRTYYYIFSEKPKINEGNWFRKAIFPVKFKMNGSDFLTDMYHNSFVLLPSKTQKLQHFHLFCVTLA